MVTVDSFSGNKTLNTDWQKKKAVSYHRMLKSIYCSFIIPHWVAKKDINMSYVCKGFFFFFRCMGLCSAVIFHIISKAIIDI